MVFRFLNDHRDDEQTVRLRAIPLFSTLSARELHTVASLMHERSYLRDEVIFDEGEEGQAIYIVFGGRVLICRQGQPEQGRIAELGPGTFFGDLALIENLPRAAQARALEPCQLGVFFRNDFLSLLDTHAVTASKIALELARTMGVRLRDAMLQVGAPFQRHL
jgi:CRP-like cAMP-binding protein